MMTVHLIADSASDLPKSYIEENRIGFIPLHVTLDGNEYEDAVTIQADHIFQAMRDGKVPKTSQASPDTIKKYFYNMRNWENRRYTSPFPQVFPAPIRRP